MKELPRKTLALSLAVFLISPALAWSGADVSVDAGGVQMPAAGEGLLNQEPISIPDIDFNATIPTENLGAITLLSASNIERALQVQTAPAAAQAPTPVFQSASSPRVESPAPTVQAGDAVAPNAPTANSSESRANWEARILENFGFSKKQISGAKISDGQLTEIYEGASPVLADAAEGSAEASESSSGSDENEISEESRKLHEEYEKTSVRSLEQFKASVLSFHAGRFGLILMAVQRAGGDADFFVAPTLDGKLIAPSIVEKMLENSEITAAERPDWEAAQAAQQKFSGKLGVLLRFNEQAHQLVHQRMEAIEHAIAVRKVKARLAIGTGLEAWGLPNAISVDLGGPNGLRYSKLYRMSGMPTDLGAALHEILAPLIAKDPAVLSKITHNQIHDAIRFLAQGQKYVLDPSSEDFKKLKRMGAISEGYSYPEWRAAFAKKAQDALLAQSEPDDAAFGLGMRSADQRPAEILKGILHDAISQYQALAQEGGVAKENLQPLQELIMAISAATGIPIDMGAGPMMSIVRHRQLLPILAELKKRGVDEEVVTTVIRSFPLGESLYRMRVHKLWEKGLTGKGVKVAILDNGVGFDHPDFAGVKSLSENLTRDRGEFTRGSHGTPMADIIHAIAPEAEIQSYQVLSNAQRQGEPLAGVRLSQTETYDAVLKAMDRAKANGAQVISLSLGFPMGLADDALTRKISELAKEGILFVVSSGNEGFDLPENLQLRTPGTATDAITVGAVDYHGNKAYFSSSGEAMNPKDYSLQDKPDIYAFGVHVKAAARLSKDVYKEETVPYMDVSGTSPAAPHISGLAALMVQATQDKHIDTQIPATVSAAKAALLAAAHHVARLPVLDDAEKAVEEFVRILSAGN